MHSFHFSPGSSYCLYAPMALTGPELELEKNILLRIENGLITGLKTIPPGNLPGGAGSGVQLIKLDQGLTLMPCLIDAHVHLALDGVSFKDSVSRWDNEGALQSRIKKDLQAAATAGIGAVRDGGDCRRINLAARDNFGEESLSGTLKPRVISTGAAVRSENSYGPFLGRGYRKPEEIPAFIEALHAAGVDQVKLIASGLVNFSEYGRVDGKIPAPEELEAVVFHARRFGLKVMVHASSDVAVKRAVQAGVDSIEHGYYAEKDTLQLMAENQVAWVPTISPVAAGVANSLFKDGSGRGSGLLEKICEEHIEKLRFALHSEVILGAGSDAGAPGVKHGAGLTAEMSMYARGALSNRFILRAATAANAQIVGLDGDMGAIRCGLKPELIAVRGNPLHDLAALKQVQMRFSTGHYSGAEERTFSGREGLIQGSM